MDEGERGGGNGWRCSMVDQARGVEVIGGGRDGVPDEGP